MRVTRWAAVGAVLVFTLGVEARQDGQRILLQPGSVTAVAGKTSIWLANGSLVATWNLEGGFRLASIYDRLGGRPAPRTGEVFELTLDDGRTIKGSEMRMLEPARVEEISVQGGGATGHRAPAGRSLRAAFESADRSIHVNWRAILLEGADYVRQEIEIAAIGKTASIASVALVDVQAKDARPIGAPPSAAAAGGGAFVVVEHEAGRCDVQEMRIRCGVAAAGKAIDAGSPLRLSSVIGLSRPSELRASLLRYAQREAAHVPRHLAAGIEQLTAGASAPRATPAALATPIQLVAGPYLQSPGLTEMTVMWMTERPSAGWVEYGEAGAFDRTALPSRDGLLDADTRIHRVRLTSLKPDTAYAYRVVSREILHFGPYKVDYAEPVRSEASTFKTLTAGARPFTFVVLNDLHEDVEVMAGHMGRAKVHAPELVFFNGDSLSHLESEQQIVDKLLKPAGNLFASRTPLLLVRGNHETRGRFARRLGDYLALPGGRYYYSFDHGPVHFIVLDCGEDKEDEHWAYSGLTAFDEYRAAEAEWLRREVASPAFRNASFRVLVAHMPFFGNEGTRVDGHGPSACREEWGQILNDAGLDLHIAGHTHRANWVPAGAGGNRFSVLVGGSSARGSSTMTRVEVTADKLTIEVTKDDGTVAGNYTVAARERR